MYPFFNPLNINFSFFFLFQVLVEHELSWISVRPCIIFSLLYNLEQVYFHAKMHMWREYVLKIKVCGSELIIIHFENTLHALALYWLLKVEIWNTMQWVTFGHLKHNYFSTHSAHLVHISWLHKVLISFIYINRYIFVIPSWYNSYIQCIHWVY